MMKKFLLTTVAVLGLGVSAAQAAPTNVGGVIWDPTDFGDAEISSSFGAESVAGGIFGGEVRGYGLVSDINTSVNGSFCDATNCELTYEFGGFTVNEPDVDGDGYSLVFTGGWINFYVQDLDDGGSTSFDINDASKAIDGNLWLSLVAVTDTRPEDSGPGTHTGTLFSELTGTLGSGSEAGTGVGFMEVAAAAGTMRGTITNFDGPDVDPDLDMTLDLTALTDVTGQTGLANDNFDTNGRLTEDGQTLADFFFQSEFAPFNNQPFNSGFSLSVENKLTGDSITVPEPAALGLMGFGLVGMGLMARRRRS